MKRKNYKGYIASFRADSDGLWFWELVNARREGPDTAHQGIRDLLDGRTDVKDRLASGFFHDSAQNAVAAFLAYVDELTLFDPPEGPAAPHAGEITFQVAPEEHFQFASWAAHYDMTTEQLAATLIRRHIDRLDGFDEEVAEAQIQAMRDGRDQAIARGEAEPSIYSDHIADAALGLPGVVEPDDPITAQEKVRQLVREGDVEGAIRVFRKLRNASWTNLQKAAHALLNEDHDPFSTANVEASSKSHIRTLNRWTELTIPQLSKHIDDIADGISS